MRLVTLALCLLPVMSIAADQPKTYEGEPPKIVLTADETKRVNAGEPVYRRTQTDGGGNGVAVFTVNAPPDAVRKIILDVASYPKWIDKLKSVTTYKCKNDRLCAEFKIDFKEFLFSFKYTYSIEHDYPLVEKGWGTWKLDRSRPSDINDSIGFWRVDPVADHPEQSLVYYSLNLNVGGVANLFKSKINKEGLAEATQWVRKAAAALYPPTKQETAKSK